MSSIGTGVSCSQEHGIYNMVYKPAASSVHVMPLQYDLSAAQFSPDGRVFQIEYASKAVENSG